MNEWSKKTVAEMAKRSNIGVVAITLFFALAGGLPVIFLGGQSMGMWISLCFITIPPVHFLCRDLVRVRRKVDAWGEKRSG
jgi:hypothetical protein